MVAVQTPCFEHSRPISWWSGEMEHLKVRTIFNLRTLDIDQAKFCEHIAIPYCDFWILSGAFYCETFEPKVKAVPKGGLM